MDNCPILKKELMQHRDLLISLKQLQDNLSFPTVMMKETLQWLATDRKAMWKFSMDDIECWSCEMGARIRTMCRHTTQASSKRNPPIWALKFFDSETKELQSGKEEEATLSEGLEEAIGSEPVGVAPHQGVLLWVGC